MRANELGIFRGAPHFESSALFGNQTIHAIECPRCFGADSRNRTTHGTGSEHASEQVPEMRHKVSRAPDLADQDVAQRQTGKHALNLFCYKREMRNHI